jgi:hypothetical protein
MFCHFLGYLFGRCYFPVSGATLNNYPLTCGVNIYPTIGAKKLVELQKEAEGDDEPIVFQSSDDIYEKLSEYIDYAKENN